MSRRRRAGLLAAAALAVTLPLAGCSNPFGAFNDAVRDDTGEIAEGGQVDIFTIQVGDCLAVVPEGETSSVGAVPCAEEHDGEVFHDFSLPAGDFPGDEAVTDASLEGCDAAFGQFVGVSWDESTLDYSYYAPTEETWTELDDRLVSCVIVDPAGPVTGTLKGAAR